MTTIPMTVENVSGTRVKQVLNFLKAYRTKWAGIDALTGVDVRDGLWRAVDFGVEATVAAPVPLPDGVYPLFDVLPVLTESPVQVDVEEWGVRINGCPIARMAEDGLPTVVSGPQQVKLGPIPAGWGLVQSHAGADETRPVLRGILLDPQHEGAVATDGTRLAHIHWSAVAALPSPVIMPNLPIKDPNASLTVTFDSETHRPVSVIVSESVGTVTARVLEGAFPAWERVVPDSATCPVAVMISRERLLTWVKQVHALAKANASPAVDIIQGTVSVGGITPARVARLIDLRLDGDHAVTARDAQGTAWLSGEGSILVNPRYLLDAAKHLPKKSTIEVVLSGAERPLMLTVGALRSVILPIRQFR